MPTDICRWLFLLFFLSAWCTLTNSKEIRVVCYYTNWSVYRPGTAKFSPVNINPYLCTHLIYAFGGFTKENTLKPFDKYQDIEKGGYAKFTGLKTYNKNLKTMLAIGGWNEGSSRFSPMVANPERRKELVKNAIKFLRQNHFDGLDLDWEYPSFRDGGKSRDRDNYAQLVQELRQEFDRESEKTGRPRLLLTMAVPAGIEYVNKGYDVPKLTKYLDWMNILSYDYHSAFEPAVNHHAPLYSLEEESEYNYDGELNIDFTIKHYLKMGADPSKLVMGIPTYGRSYTLFNPEANEIGAPADGPGDMGDATRENGYLAYYEICENIKSQDWDVVQPNPDAMGPYAFRDNQWVGYDDDSIARKKSKYVAENGLGGIMFWSIDNDDFRGNCHGRPYPIIEAAKEALISAYGLTDENLISPPAKPTKSRTRTRLTSKTKNDSENSDGDVKKETSTSSRRRNRIKTKSNEETSGGRSNSRRKSSRRTTEAPVYSSLELVTPSYTTPAPPSTPDQGGVFKCEDEGFYPHPKDCKKYFWCLSGAGESGIIAHAFTCPAGLYFNKAADSCDYTQNVLCNKKLTKATTTTTTEGSTTKTTTTKTIAVTSRSKVTPITSRTTFFRTTTTEANLDDEEYYDDDFENDNSEEDPKVIKDLLDLIKKAGGIEQLEKQLKIHEDGTASLTTADVTTPSSISKTLVERVLNKAGRNNLSVKKNTYSVINRNSRGPQNEGLSKVEDKKDKKQDRGRLQYTTIARQRPQKSDEIDEENDDDAEGEEDDEPEFNKKTKQREYVNIRRGRVTSTTEKVQDVKSKSDRNRILGEESDEEDEEITKKTSNPQYVNIRRQRPPTTEESTTSKYTVIRRGTTEADVQEVSLVQRRRGSTTASVPEELTGDRANSTTISPDRGSSSGFESDSKSKYQTIKRGSTTEETASKKSSSDLSTTKYSTISSGTTDDATTIIDSDIEHSTELGTTPETLSSESSLGTTKFSTQSPNQVSESGTDKRTPLLAVPRPFSLSARDPTSSSLKPVTEQTSRVTKVSESNFKPRIRQKETTAITTTEKTVRSRTPSRFKLSTTGDAEPQTKPTSSSARARKRFSTTESYSYDEYDLNRTYRPSEIADLSSLTAVDFTSGVNRFGGGSRHRRPRPSTATTTEKVEESLKTGPRTLPLARKLLDGKSRRIAKVEDQINSSSDLATTHKVREEFDKTTPKIDSSTETIRGFGKNTERLRGFGRITSSPTKIDSSTENGREFSKSTFNSAGISSSTDSTVRTTLRNRKIIRRLFRPTSTTEGAVEDDLQKSSSINTGRSNLSRFRIKPAEVAVKVSSIKPLNTRKNTSTSRGTTAETEEYTTVSESLNETSDESSGEEGENIKLSESNIRENNDVNNNNIIATEGKSGRKIVLKRVKSKVDSEKGATEPNIIVRTRKIVRKLRPTEATILLTTTESPVVNVTESSDVSTLGRKRKVIRRFRPTTATVISSTTVGENKTIFIRGRPFSTTEKISTVEQETVFSADQNTTEQTSTEEIKDVEKAKSVRSRYKPIQRTTTESETVSLENQSTTSSEGIEKEKTVRSRYRPIQRTTERTSGGEGVRKFAIDRSKYSAINRGTTSSTSRYELRSTVPTVSDNEEEYDDEQEYDDVEGDVIPKYKIIRPNDDEDEASDNDEETSSRYTILRPTLESQVSDSDEDNKAIKILRPSLPSQAVEDVSDRSKLVEVESAEENDDDDQEEANEKSADTESSQINSTTPSTSDLNTETDELVDESEGEKIAVTVRNYKNSILEKQKNRPVFRRPKFTTEKSKITPAIIKSRYKTFTRPTTASPKTEIDTIKQLELEKKYVPKEFTTEPFSIEEVIPNVTVNEANLGPEILNITQNFSMTETPTTYRVESTTVISVDSTHNILKEEDQITDQPQITTTAESDNFTEVVKETTTENQTTIEAVSTTESDVKTVNVTELEDDNYMETTTQFNDFTTINEVVATNNANNETEELVNSTYIETSTVDSSNLSSETTPVYHPKSTLRSIQARPKFSIPKRLSNSSPEPKLKRVSFRNREHAITENLKITTLISIKNKGIYKYSTTERTRYVAKEESSEEIVEYDDIVDDVEVTTSKFKTPSTAAKPRSSNKPAGYGFTRKTTEPPKVNEDLSGVNTEAVKNRNKSLFSKKRKINSPIAVSAATLSATTESKPTSPLEIATNILETTTPLITESVTKPTTILETTTELLTTLHHVFAETESSTEKISNSTDEHKNGDSSKVERLIEVNRIIEVHGERDMKNNTSLETDNKVVDKVGAVNRVTVIKVIDPEENEINPTDISAIPITTGKPEVTLNINGAFVVPEIATVKEVTLPDPFLQVFDRQNRKYESYSDNKDVIVQDKPVIIDGKSHINIITPRPHYSTEASTIALEGLFQTDTPQILKDGITANLLKPTGEEELLETGNSRYVNIRVLEEENGHKAKLRDDYITMKADVVEVTPKNKVDTIRIVPIKVEMSRKLIGNADFNTKIESGVPKVELKIINSA